MEQTIQLFRDLQTFFSILNTQQLFKLYAEFTQNSEEVLKKIHELCPEADLSEEQLTSYSFNHDTKVRTHIQCIEGELIVDATTFDDKILNILRPDIQKIVIAIERLPISCPSEYSFKQNARFTYTEYLNLIKDVNLFKFEHLSKEFTAKLLNELNKIEHAFSKIGFIPNIVDRPATKLREQKASLIYSSNPAKLIHLYAALKKCRFIRDVDDKSELFKSIFSGNLIPLEDEEKIVWSNQKALKYFISAIANIRYQFRSGSVGKNAFALPPEKWKFVCNYFIQPGKKEFKYIGNESDDLSLDQQKVISDILTSLEL